MDEGFEGVAARLVALNLHLGSPWLRSIRTRLLDFREFVLTRELALRSRIPNLQPGQPPQLKNLPSNGLNSVPRQSGPPPRPPGLHKPHTTQSGSGPLSDDGSFQRQTQEPETIGLWRLVCFAVALILVISLLFNYDPLEIIIDIESVKEHASFENATLAFEKEKTERERKMMAHERELWEKAREARVPQNAFWDVVWPAWDCRAYGKREYWGLLRNIPGDWDRIDACMSMPVEIKGVKVRHPDRCAGVLVFPEIQIRGYWMVDWDQPDCKPWYRDFEDKVYLLSSPHVSVFMDLRTGVHGLQLGKASDPSSDCGGQREGGTGLEVVVYQHAFGLGPGHIYEPCTL